MPDPKRLVFQRTIGLIGLGAALLVIYLALRVSPVLSGTHPYPMLRAGGVFLVIVGSSIVAGALFPQALWRILAAGVAVASLVLTFTARPLTVPMGIPTSLQIGALAAAIVVEIALIFFLPRLFPPKDDRMLPLLIMLAVGVHFLIMTPAFGPLIAALGLLAIVNAGIGLWSGWRPDWHLLWFVDGLLKLSFGAAMVWFPAIGM